MAKQEQRIVSQVRSALAKHSEEAVTAALIQQGASAEQAKAIIASAQASPTGGGRRFSRPSVKLPEFKIAPEKVLAGGMLGLTLVTFLFWINNPEHFPFKEDPTQQLIRTRSMAEAGTSMANMFNFFQGTVYPETTPEPNKTPSFSGQNCVTVQRGEGWLSVQRRAGVTNMPREKYVNGPLITGKRICFP